MKRLVYVVLASILVLSAIGGAANLKVNAQDKVLKIGLVTDAGGVDDRSFNQSAWEGVLKIGEELGDKAEYDYVQSKAPEDYANNIRQFADQGYNVIITVGFALSDATHEAAKQYPDIHFIGVDQFQAEELANVTGLIFPEAKSGFLAGVLAARLTKSGTIAAVLGTDQVPPVVAFKEGYEAGAYWAAGNGDVEAGKGKLKILSTYHPGGLAVAFVDPKWGADTAAQAMDQGADVVFGAGGKTGNGALQEVAKRTTADKPLFCIGVDTDQWETLPEAHPCLVSSAMKLITDGVVELIKMHMDGSVPAGNFQGKVALAPFHDFEKIVPAEVAQEIADVKAMLESGELNADGTKGEPMATATMEATAAK